MAKQPKQQIEGEFEVDRGGARIGVKKIKDPFPSGLYYYDNENRYQSLYPSIYSIKLQGHGYFPFWDFFTLEYFIRNDLINARQLAAYVLIASLRNQGLRLSIMGDRGPKGDREELGLAEMLRVSPRTLIADLDHLEDCLLIHRVRRQDIHGTPNDIVVHTPFTPAELYEGGWLKEIKARIAREATRTARQKMMVSGVGSDGRPFKNLDRSGNRFQYDSRQIADAFGYNAAKFAEFALTYFRKHFWVLFKDKPAFDHDYRELLRTELNLYGIGKNADREKCYIAANKFRTIYCPSYEELLAT